MSDTIWLCRTCKRPDWLEVYSSTQTKSGKTAYCRRCEEGCVEPVAAPMAVAAPQDDYEEKLRLWWVRQKQKAAKSS